jgi:hypothetical protein
MELNFSELDNINTQNPYENVGHKTQTNININNEKYWEGQNIKKQNIEKSKKKKVSFDDILSNMNLVVNKSGVLQFMSHTQPIEAQYPQQQSHQQQNYQQQNYQQQDYQQQSKNEPLDPSVKNSFIYNKYFKDYQDANKPAPQVKVPKTKEEYLQMLIEDRLQRIEQQKRISEIKSRKLLFTSNVGNNGNIMPTKNTLRSMSFR